MLEKIYEIIAKYKVWTIAIIGAILILISTVLGNFVVSETRGALIEPPPELIRNGINLVFLSIWICFSLSIIININYTDVTGRDSLWRDRRTFNRTFWELRRYFKDADPYRLRPETLEFGDWRFMEGIILGKLRNRIIRHSSSWNNGDGVNVAVYGTPGSGKTSACLKNTALQFGGPVLCIDIKGDIAETTKSNRRIKFFNPDNPKNSCTFNPLYGFKALSNSEKRAVIEELSRIIIPDDKNGKYFVDTGRSMFCGAFFWHLEQNPDIPFADIVNNIMTHNAQEWIDTIAVSDTIIAKQYVSALDGSNMTNVQGAYGELVQKLRSLFTEELLSLLREDENSITPATLDAGYDIYITIPQHKLQFYSVISTILVQRFFTSFQARQDSGVRSIPIKPICVILDEFPQLNFDYNDFTTALSTLRSKSVSIVFACQSTSQLATRYGEHGFIEIMDCCRYVSVFGVTDPNSRKYFSDLAGTRKTLAVTSNVNSSNDTSTASSRGATETREPCLQPEFFSNLGKHVVCFIDGKYIVAEKAFCHKT